MIEDPRCIDLAIRLALLDEGVDSLSSIDAFDDRQIFSDDLYEICYNEAGIGVHNAGKFLYIKPSFFFLSFVFNFEISIQGIINRQKLI